MKLKAGSLRTLTKIDNSLARLIKKKKERTQINKIRNKKEVTTESESEVAQSCPTLCDPMDCSLPRFSVHGIFPGTNTGVGCHFLLQRIFPTQRSNPGLLHYRQMLYCLSYQGSPTQLYAAAAAKSLQSCPTLCDPIDGSPPGSPPPSLGFSRQEHWSGLPFPSPMHESEK